MGIFKPLAAVLVFSSFGAGIFLGSIEATKGQETDEDVDVHQDLDDAKDSSEVVKLNNQFVVPVLEDGLVASLVIVSLSIETNEGSREQIFLLEAKLRDGLLSALFDHANSGYFSGTFTEHRALDSLRVALKEKASSILSVPVYGVLITDLVRQDQI